MKVKAKRPAASTSRAVLKRGANGGVAKKAKAPVSKVKGQEETEQPKKVEPKVEATHKRIQTAEGWKRSMMKKVKKQKAK